MGVWDDYVDRISMVGSMRDAVIEDAKLKLAMMIPDSPSCHEVLIGGEPQLITITHGQYLYEKKIAALPGEHLPHGGYVEYADNVWLITEMDADDEIYERGKMLQCNYVVKWIGKDGKLKEKWCFVEDGTKYLIGEYSERMMAVGDARLAMTIGKDADTIELSRGARFLIDDGDSPVVSAYQITKTNKLWNQYNGRGVFKFILNEDQTTAADNIEQRIADYTNWEPNIPRDTDHQDSESTVDEIVAVARARATMDHDDNKKGWL